MASECASAQTIDDDGERAKCIAKRYCGISYGLKNTLSKYPEFVQSLGEPKLLPVCTKEIPQAERLKCGVQSQKRFQMFQIDSITIALSRLVSALLVVAIMAAHAAAEVADYIGVPGPIEFAGKSYELAWSSQPADNYVKQEYVPSGQNVETYAQMLLVEVVTGKTKVIDAVRSQVDMLNRRKGSDPLVNMSVIENKATGEALLDFIVSSKNAKGEYIVE
jgi:hypothetical protein